MFSNELKDLGFVNVNYPTNLRNAVDTAVESWKKFCFLKKEDKLAFTFLEDAHGDGAGYELKEEKGTKKDLKENFHITLFQYERLAMIANNRTFPFLKNAKTLLDNMEPLILSFAQSIEEKYQIPGLLKQVVACKPYWILRYLHYLSGQNEGTEIAAPHADKGGFTLHLYESDEGLQYLCFTDKTWKPMPVHKEQTVIISAMQLQLRSQCELKALYHRVVATKKSAKEGRFSMVCFIPFQDMPMYNKKSFGSMQKHDIGFNYEMPQQEFSNLFSSH